MELMTHKPVNGQRDTGRPVTVSISPVQISVNGIRPHAWAFHMNLSNDEEIDEVALSILTNVVQLLVRPRGASA